MVTNVKYRKQNRLSDMGAVVFTTLGRPTKYTSALMNIIVDFRATKVIGIYSNEEKGLLHNYVGQQILKEWNNREKELKARDIETGRIDVKLLEFINNQPKPIGNELPKHDQIVEIGIQILKEILGTKTEKIVLDLSSGRRLLSPIMTNVAIFLKNLFSSSEFTKEMNSSHQPGTLARLEKLHSLEFHIVTRPEHTARATKTERSEDQEKIKEVPVDKREQSNQYELYTYQLKSMPILSMEDAMVLFLYDKEKKGKRIANKLGISPAKVSKIKKEKLDTFNLLKLNSNKTDNFLRTNYGRSLGELYGQVYNIEEELKYVNS